jgi:hypothetical protein
MAEKLIRLTHKVAIQLHLVTAVPFAILVPGGQSGNFWTHSRIAHFPHSFKLFRHDREDWKGINTLKSNSGGGGESFRNSVGISTILIDVFRGFPQTLHASPDVLPSNNPGLSHSKSLQTHHSRYILIALADK